MRFYRDFRNQQVTQILHGTFPPNRPLSILDVGCGTGVLLEHLASLPERHELFGVDGTLEMLRQTERRFDGRQPRPRLSLGSCDALPFPDASFDVITATRLIHLFNHEEKKQVYRELHRVLRFGGIAIVEFYARPFHWLRYHLMRAGKNKSKISFFSHYPTIAEVRDIVGTFYTNHPIRLAGSRYLLPVTGERLLGWLTRATPWPGRNPLIDEYFVVTRK